MDLIASNQSYQFATQPYAGIAANSYVASVPLYTPRPFYYPQPSRGDALEQEESDNGNLESVNQVQEISTDSHDDNLDHVTDPDRQDQQVSQAINGALELPDQILSVPLYTPKPFHYPQPSVEYLPDQVTSHEPGSEPTQQLEPATDDAYGEEEPDHGPHSTARPISKAFEPYTPITSIPIHTSRPFNYPHATNDALDVFTTVEYVTIYITGTLEHPHTTSIPPDNLTKAPVITHIPVGFDYSQATRESLESSALESYVPVHTSSVLVPPETTSKFTAIPTEIIAVPTYISNAFDYPKATSSQLETPTQVTDTPVNTSNSLDASPSSYKLEIPTTIMSDPVQSAIPVSDTNPTVTNHPGQEGGVEIDPDQEPQLSIVTPVPDAHKDSDKDQQHPKKPSPSPQHTSHPFNSPTPVEDENPLHLRILYLFAPLILPPFCLLAGFLLAGVYYVHKAMNSPEWRKEHNARKEKRRKQRERELKELDGKKERKAEEKKQLWHWRESMRVERKNERERMKYEREKERRERRERMAMNGDEESGISSGVGKRWSLLGSWKRRREERREVVGDVLWDAGSVLNVRTSAGGNVMEMGDRASSRELEVLGMSGTLVDENRVSVEELKVLGLGDPFSEGDFFRRSG